MMSSVIDGMNQIAYTLDADSYISPDLHKKELEAIFYRTWQFACHSSQVKNAGDYFSFSVGTQEIFVIRGKDDLVRAFFNVCPHRAHPLVNGHGNTQSLVCPYHAWTFFLNGQLCRARGSENVEGFDPARFNLSEARIEEFMGFLFVNLDEKAPPLKSLSGHLGAELKTAQLDDPELVHVGSRTIESQANWKVIVDYHLDPHSEDLTIPAETNSIYTLVRTNMWWLWPNWLIRVLPGTRAIALISVRSLDVRRTQEDMHVFSLSDEDTQKATAWLEDKRHTHRATFCAQVHNGMHSRAFQRGPLFINRNKDAMSEHALQHFHTLVRDALSRLKVSSKTLRPGQREANAPV